MPPLAAPRASPYGYRLAFAAEGAALAIDEEVVVLVFGTRSLGLLCCLAFGATLFSRAPPVKQIDALPGAVKIAVGSGSFFRSSGSGASAIIGTPLCSCSNASYIYNKDRILRCC